MYAAYNMNSSNDMMPFQKIVEFCGFNGRNTPRSYCLYMYNYILVNNIYNIDIIVYTLHKNNYRAK